MSITQNTALFSLLGTYYGGDGRSTFGLPNLQGSVPINMGQGAGLSSYFIGQLGGETNHTLTQNEMAAHTHALNGDHGSAVVQQPGGNYFGSGARLSPLYGNYVDSTSMAAQIVAPNTGGQPHLNQQPYLTMTLIIAIQGVYPQRP